MKFIFIKRVGWDCPSLICISYDLISSSHALASMFISIKLSAVLFPDFNLGIDFERGRLQTWSLTKPHTLKSWGKRSSDCSNQGIIPTRPSQTRTLSLKNEVNSVWKKQVVSFCKTKLRSIFSFWTGIEHIWIMSRYMVLVTVFFYERWMV